MASQFSQFRARFFRLFLPKSRPTVPSAFSRSCLGVFRADSMINPLFVGFSLSPSEIRVSRDSGVYRGPFFGRYLPY